MESRKGCLGNVRTIEVMAREMNGLIKKLHAQQEAMDKAGAGHLDMPRLWREKQETQIKIEALMYEAGQLGFYQPGKYRRN